MSDLKIMFPAPDTRPVIADELLPLGRHPPTATVFMVVGIPVGVTSDTVMWMFGPAEHGIVTRQSLSGRRDPAWTVHFDELMPAELKR